MDDVPGSVLFHPFGLQNSWGANGLPILTLGDTLSVGFRCRSVCGCVV